MAEGEYQFLDIDGLKTTLSELQKVIPSYTAFKGATSSSAGDSGLVPAPDTLDADRYLKGDSTWADVSDNATDIEISESQPSSQDNGGVWIELGGGR